MTLPVIDLNTQVYVGIPVLSLLVYAIRLLWKTTIAQREMHTYLFGRDGIPGILLDHDERIGALENAQSGVPYKSRYFRGQHKENRV